MAAQQETHRWRVGLLAARVDVVLGLGIVVAGLTGHLGENWAAFTFGGAALAAGGLGWAVWTHNKADQGFGPDRRQD